MAVYYSFHLHLPAKAMHYSHVKPFNISCQHAELKTVLQTECIVPLKHKLGKALTLHNRSRFSSLIQTVNDVTQIMFQVMRKADN